MKELNCFNIWISPRGCQNGDSRAIRIANSRQDSFPVFCKNQNAIYSLELFRDGGSYHIETSPLVCRANQWTGFDMILISVTKGLTQLVPFFPFTSVLSNILRYSEVKLQPSQVSRSGFFPSTFLYPLTSKNTLKLSFL